MDDLIKRVAKATQETAAAMGSPFDDFVAAEIAKSAIEAMREPTPDMLHAGFCCGRDASPKEVWETMISSTSQ